MRRERGETVEQLQMCLHGELLVPGRDQHVAEIAHEESRTQPVPTQATGRADHPVIDPLGQYIHESGAPDVERDAARLVEEAHRPVVVDVDVFQNVGLAVDHYPLETNAGLRIAVQKRLALGGAGEQFVD